MLALLRVVGVFLVGFAALGTLAWGWVWWLPVALELGEEYGPVWRGAALAGMGVLSVLAAWGFWRLQDHLSRGLDYRGGPVRDRLFCQRCGAPGAAGAVACGVCGGTVFGLTRRSHRTGR